MEENFELTKQKLIEETKSLIDVIVKSITPEEPIMYFFITNDIVSKEKSNNAGTIVGGLLGGVHGAIIGSVFNQTLRNFTGKIGVVVITKDIIYLKLGFNTDIISPSIIFHEQLKVFLSEISSNKTKEFLICKSQVILINDKNLYNHPNYIIGQSRIISDNINIPIVDAKVYINEKDYIILPTHNNFVKLCNDLGSLITPELFVEKILLNENPINEMLFNNIENDSKYFQQLSSKIISHKQRNLLVVNFACLLPSFRSILLESIEKQANSYRVFLNRTILMFVLSTFAIFASIYYIPDLGAQIFMSCCSGMFWLFGFFGSIGHIKHIKWCKNVKSIT